MSISQKSRRVTKKAKNSIYTSVKSNEEVVRQLDITVTDIYCKPGNTSLLKGIDKSFLDKVRTVKWSREHNIFMF